MLSKSRQCLFKIVVKDELYFLENNYEPLYNYFTRILPLNFKQRCIPFWNLENIYFTKSLSVTAYDSSARVLINGFCNVILHVCRTCWKTFWINPPTHLWLIFNQRALNSTKVQWFLRHLVFLLCAYSFWIFLLFNFKTDE